MKTIKDLKEGDILFVVHNTTIEETIIKNFYVRELPVFTDILKFEREEKPHYFFDVWRNGHKYTNFTVECDEFKDETDTARRNNGVKEYTYLCGFINKMDAIKFLKKNVISLIEAKEEMIKSIKKEIDELKNKLVEEES